MTGLVAKNIGYAEPRGEGCPLGRVQRSPQRGKPEGRRIVDVPRVGIRLRAGDGRRRCKLPAKPHGDAQTGGSMPFILGIDSPLLRGRILSLKFVDLLSAGNAGENLCRVVEVIIHKWAAAIFASIEVGGRLHPRSAELKQVLAVRPGERLGDIRLVL